MSEADNSQIMSLIFSPETDRQTFFLLYSKLISDRLPTFDMMFVDETTLLLSAPDQRQYVYLENLWIQFERKPDDRIRMLQEHLSAITEIVTNNDTSLPNVEQIVPMVKDQQYVDLFTNSLSAVTEHLAADLWIVYGVDQGNRIRILSSTDAEKLGITLSELRKIALKNVRSLLSRLRVTDGSGPLHSVTGGGPLVPSILLLDEIWQDLSARVEGDLIAAVPSGEAIFFTGSHSVRGLVGLSQIVQKRYAMDDHIVSPTFLRWSGGRWQPFS